MEHRLKFKSNITHYLFQYLYTPLKETFPGSHEDFNALMFYIASLFTLPLWSAGLTTMKIKGNLPCKTPLCDSVNCEKCLADKKQKILSALLKEMNKHNDKMKSTNLDELIKNLLNDSPFHKEF